MPLGYETAVVNGQMVNVAPPAGYDPIIFGQAYTGPAMWLRQGVYNVPPVLPSGSLQGTMAPSQFGWTGAVAPSATDSNGSPFSFSKSPLWMAMIFLIVGILLLQHVHYR